MENNIDYKPICIGCYTPFQLFSPKSWLNWAIRAFTRDLQKTEVSFDHIMTIFFLNGESFVDEALGSGVKPSSLIEYTANNKKRKRTHYQIDTTGRNFELLAESWGAHYQLSTFWKIIPFIFARRIFGSGSKITYLLTFKDDPKKYVCSERAGWQFNLSEKPYLLVPNDFLKYGFKPIDLNKYVNN